MLRIDDQAVTQLKPLGVDVRDAFFDELYALATKDCNLMLLTDDMGAFSLEKFKRDLCCQYINMGIAEQNMITIAAGFALGGKIPFIYGISAFMTMRCYEQIKVDLCCMNLPVTIVGSGPGYTYGSDGPTHHATQDIAIMRALPEMTILNPSDAVMTTASVGMAYKNRGPTYIRLEKGILPCLYEEGSDFSEGFHILKKGREIMIVSTGVMVHRALKVADELSKYSVDVGVLDLYRIKPINVESILSVLSNAQRLVTIEENSIISGIGSLICELLIDAGRTIPLKRLAIPDKHVFEYGNREWILSLYGLNEDSLTETILEWLRKC